MKNRDRAKFSYMKKLSSNDNKKNYKLLLEDKPSKSLQKIKSSSGEPSNKELVGVPLSISEDLFLVDSDLVVTGETKLESVSVPTPTNPQDAVNKKYVDDNLTTGDITGVTITTDSGGGSAASDTEGSADFSILGSSGVGVTNSGTTITAVAVPAEIDHDSLNNFVANEHIDWTAASAGTIHATNYSAGASALNDLSDVTYSSGDLTISSLDKIVTSGSLTIDSGSNIELNADGGFVNMKDGSASMVTATRPDSVTGELQIYPNNFGDISKITATTHGATTISTSDVDGTAGHLTLDANGDIILDSDTGNFIAKKGGTEFSAANSAYAGMILGYTCLRGDGTNISTFEIQNALTVEDASHKVTFKTPPSENVEIEAIFLVNASSTDTRIAVGLSDSSTYNAVGQIHEYDGNAVWFTDDEIDDSLITVKFVLTSSELASIGSDNTFWIGISTDGVTKTAYLSYGLRSAFGIGEHPFIIKATALPGTIYTG